MTLDGRSNRAMDIKCRIGQAKQAFTDMRNILSARNLGFGGRKCLFQCKLWSVLLYG